MVKNGQKKIKNSQKTLDILRTLVNIALMPATAVISSMVFSSSSSGNPDGITTVSTGTYECLTCTKNATTGAILQRYNYTTFDNATAENLAIALNFPQFFHGEYYDNDTGLSNYGYIYMQDEIASLLLSNRTTKNDILVRIFTPYQISRNHWYCIYEIKECDQIDSMHIYGVDAMQALTFLKNLPWLFIFSEKFPTNK